MAILKEGSVITLEDKYKYNVIFSTVLNGDNYIFVSNVDNIVDSCFYKNNSSNHLELVKNGETIEQLLNLYKEKTNDDNL